MDLHMRLDSDILHGYGDTRFKEMAQRLIFIYPQLPYNMAVVVMSGPGGGRQK